MNTEHDGFSYHSYSISDVGLVRTNNQDRYGNYEGRFGCLCVVCDGMGGYTGGEIAAQLAVEAIAQHFSTLDSDFDEARELRNSILHAENRIAEISRKDRKLSQMGTTLVILLLKDGKAWYAWVGDSRIYLFRQGVLTPLSKDHSYVQELIDGGLITDEESFHHPQKNILTRALGSSNYEPDFGTPFVLEDKDVLMLCTDGLSNAVHENDMISVLTEDPETAGRALLQKALYHGGKDNITLSVVAVHAGL